MAESIERFVSGMQRAFIERRIGAAMGHGDTLGVRFQ
jgi:hypothetical protein